MLTFLSLFALALGLAMDAFAASLAQGVTARPSRREALRVGAAFGAAQAIMPLIGYVLGVAFAPVIRDIDHWIALILLGLLGGRMMVAGLHPDEDGAPSGTLSNAALLSAAIATSIDAAVAGITLPLLGAPILIAIAVIGLVTFVLSYVGVHMGAALGTRVGGRAEIAGGVLLALLGAKIFIEHQFLGG